jgi:hypothetical protein
MTNETNTAIITKVINLVTSDRPDPITQYLTDTFCEIGNYDTAEQMIDDLYSASWESGSFGLCYTYELFDKLAVHDWQLAINGCLEEYEDATGESLSISNITDTVTFAIDWTANQIASSMEFHLEEVAEELGEVA